MGILSTFAKSVLGLKNKAPQTFGVDPAGALHNQYSTKGSPDVKWRTISGEGMKPRPSKLDDLKGKYKPGKGAYLQNLPTKK
jgi:hypothetical protein